jgi:anti-anti-sigma factor
MKIKTVGDISITVIVPRFDAYTAGDVEKELKDQMAKGTRKIVADFSNNEYIASAGLRVLLSTAKSLHNSGGQIVLFAMKPRVYEVFEMSGFTQIFKIFNSQKEALESLKST